MRQSGNFQTVLSAGENQKEEIRFVPQPGVESRGEKNHFYDKVSDEIERVYTHYRCIQVSIFVDVPECGPVYEAAWISTLRQPLNRKHSNPIHYQLLESGSWLDAVNQL